jgi:malate dehydrogenase (oxaloacetate-decarboxylating)
VLPSIENLRSTSATVALGVARQAIEEGVAQVDLPDPERAVRDAMWTAALTPLELD